MGASLAPEGLPLALARVQRGLEVGAVVELAVELSPDARGVAAGRLADIVTGAGFEVGGVDASSAGRLRCRARRARTLADSVGPRMRVLVCGLNPSLLAADLGVPFARPGNRFWPAALAAGLASVDRDPDHALHRHGLGMTDLVKRATPGAAELASAEYVAGMARLERLCAWLAPEVVCFVGLAGWRAAVDGRARAGPQPSPFGGRPVYLMPNTSGRNAHASLEGLRDHLRGVLEMSGRVLVTPPPHTDRHVVLETRANRQPPH